MCLQDYLYWDNKCKHLIYSQTGESLMQEAIENYNIIDYLILHSSFTCDCEH